MTDEATDCLCVIDCSGLCDIARIQSDNLRAVLLHRLQDGTIGVPTRAWREFGDAYPDEAAELEAYITNKIKTLPAHRHNAARLAERLNSGFSRGVYDQHSELFTASVASLNGYTILTAASQIALYGQLGCGAVDVVQWATQA